MDTMEEKEHYEKEKQATINAHVYPRLYTRTYGYV